MEQIGLAVTEQEIRECFPVMAQLRPHLGAEEFAQRVRGQMAAGYRLVSLRDGATVLAVAGFRVGTNLAWGRFLYVDDLVTDANCRSQGHGKRLLAWLTRYAREQGCAQLHLDSGLQRAAAHKFYQREGLALASYHFSLRLGPAAE